MSAPAGAPLGAPASAPADAPPTRSSDRFWRRNRRGLILLPVAALLAFGAASGRLVQVRTQVDYSEVHWPDPQGWVGVTEKLTGQEYRVRLVTIRTVREVFDYSTGMRTAVTIPERSDLWQIVMDWDGPSGGTLVCRGIFLRDSDDNRYAGKLPGLLDGRGQIEPVNPCPTGAYGVDPDNTKRAASTIVSYVVTPQGVRPDRVEIRTTAPQVIAVRVAG